MDKNASIDASINAFLNVFAVGCIFGSIGGIGHLACELIPSRLRNPKSLSMMMTPAEGIAFWAWYGMSFHCIHNTIITISGSNHATNENLTGSFVINNMAFNRLLCKMSWNQSLRRSFYSGIAMYTCYSVFDRISEKKSMYDKNFDIYVKVLIVY